MSRNIAFELFDARRVRIERQVLPPERAAATIARFVNSHGGGDEYSMGDAGTVEFEPTDEPIDAIGDDTDNPTIEQVAQMLRMANSTIRSLRSLAGIMPPDAVKLLDQIVANNETTAAQVLGPLKPTL